MANTLSADITLHTAFLAAVANNPQEQELRTLYLKKYKDDPLLGMVRFAEGYVKMIQGTESDEADELLKSKVKV